MPNGQLEKMKIYAYNNPELSNQHQVGEPFTAMMNPETYTIDTKMEFNLKQGHGTSGSQPRFELKLPEEMSFEFLFDNTGIIDGNSSENLTQKIQDFALLLMGYDGSTHEPKFFKLAWGTLLFKGRCTGLNIAYKLLAKLGNAELIGPILMGLAKPVHILQRGAEVNDIVNVTSIAVVDAQELRPSPREVAAALAYS